MKKPLFLILFSVAYFSVLAQAPLVLDTAPLQAAKTVILPTYDNLLKLQTANTEQRVMAMKVYGYKQIGSTGDSFAAIGSTVYYVSWSPVSVSIFFTDKTPYTHALEKDIQKRFPDASRTDSGEKTDYHIKINDPSRRLTSVTITIDHGNDDGDGGSASLFKD